MLLKKKADTFGFFVLSLACSLRFCKAIFAVYNNIYCINCYINMFLLLSCRALR